eukprot:GCRY01003271.1.p1 GENE.GCRY01003271.1~~GCRY01003271.1.p1  ORF type:complete len:229 (+),score=8.25 GCRY01003271.1:122-808(+)
MQKTDKLVFTSEEIQFLGEESLLRIIPKFNLPSLQLISCELGPFKAGRPIQVPMWIAFQLKKQGRCSIIPPNWLSVDYLETVLEADKNNKGLFQNLPFHYIEISHLFLSYAQDDLNNHTRIFALIEDIMAVRKAKLRNGLLTLNEEAPAVMLNNLSRMELNLTRPFLVKTLELFSALSPGNRSDFGVDRADSVSGDSSHLNYATSQTDSSQDSASPSLEGRRLRRYHD